MTPYRVLLYALLLGAGPAAQAQTTDVAIEAGQLVEQAAPDAKKKLPGLTEEQAARAAALLEHADPFVRGMAEWALAIRVASDNERRKFWPRPHPPEWYRRWSALPPATQLDNDYVRQAVALGVHRNTTALLKSATETTRRAEALAATFRQAPVAQLAALHAAQQQLEEAARARPADLASQRRLWLALRHAARAVVLAGPDLDFKELAFVTRNSCSGAHNLASYSYHQNNYRPGGDVVVQSGLAPDAPVRAVLAGRLGPGSLRGMDLWWNADKVVFAFSKQPDWTPQNAHAFEGEPTHLFEIKLDGSGLRQLTDDKKWIDTEPAYLADGGVVFGSDRAGIGSECGGWEQNAGTLNLFRLGADGQTLRRLTVNKDYDRYPHTLNNGLIAFLRWDYAERQFFSCHSLWSVRPDGTMADTIYKSHIQAAPYSLRDPRPIPNSDKLVAIACGHHNLAEGAVTLVNPNEGVNNPAGMRYVTPRAGPTEGGFGSIAAVPEGGVTDREGLYQTPWALSEKSFLVSYAWRQPGSANAALYYIDVWGHKELLHRDPLLECAYPMPLAKRERPPVLADTTRPDSTHAIAHVSNVYQDLPGIARGTVKWLRISERVNWLFDKSPHGELRWVPGNPFSPQFAYWTWAPIRVIGLVPVAEDGSAYFQVPAGLGVYFQALDENFMEIRRMRSHIAFQPGETRACIGCHESKGTQTPASSWQKSAAAARPPARPAPPPWGDCAVLDYEKMIQPIFDRSCVRCHGAENPKAGLNLTAQRDDLGFAQAYRSLFGIKPGAPTPISDGDGWYRRHFPQAKVCDGKDWFRLALENKAPGQLIAISDRTTSPWQKPIDASISQPKQFGSHQSRLVLHLLNDAAHRERLKPGSADWLTLVTWVDANAPYRSTFYQKFDDQGRALAQPLQVPLTLPPPFAAAALAQQEK